MYEKTINQSVPHGERFVTMKQLAGRVGLSPQALYSEVKRGRLRLTKFGRSTRIAESDIADWLDKLPKIGGAQ